MIQDPEQFYGRKREVVHILSRIGAARPQSVSVVGERRIGKSSLLYHLTGSETQRRVLGDHSSLVVVYLDFQQLRNLTLEHFFSTLLTQIRRACPEGPGPDAAGYAAFQNTLEFFRGQEKKLILLFDEFDVITSNANFPTEFYSFFRSMANNYAVAFVTSSKTELQRICYSSSIADSPFFNIFSNLYLRPFEREEAAQLIAVPSEKQGLPLRRFTDEIVALAGLFPLYLQIACSVYFDWLQEDPTRALEHQEVRSRFLEEAGPHFEYFWQHASAEVKEVINRIIRGHQPEPEDFYVCQGLQKDGVLVQEGRLFRLFSPVFADYIRMLESSAGSRQRSPFQRMWAGVQLAPGSHVNQYRILRKAGEGGMGIIYEAEDISLHRNVALKFIRPEFVGVETSRKRFVQEARAAASLNHPAITAIYELFEYEDQIVLVMEWVEGTTLKQHVLAEGPQPWRQVVEWLMDVCDGLEVAHQRGVVHRDIKSSNLMITSQNRVKIMDFGLAKRWRTETTVSAQLTEEGSLLGTLDYMSPEQARGQGVDLRSDLFSLGVIFFEALTGKLPFQRENAAATLQAILQEPAPHLALYWVEEADRLDPVVRRLLEKSPADRYASAAELRKDLKDLLKPKRRFFS